MILQLTWFRIVERRHDNVLIKFLRMIRRLPVAIAPKATDPSVGVYLNDEV